ncbi:MAG: helix-turn-helix transcriptional regulator [Muribaculaceae bacterium]|nr:helix-turn-helix transcriptional regulator [Muribaculaceae bacterium]
MTERFFNSYNKPEGISSEDYARADCYVQAADAISKITYESVYIIDYFKKDFLYVSSNPLFLCGLSPKKVKELGYSFYTTQVPEEEVELLLKINAIGFRFFNNHPAEERYRFSISYDFHIRKNDEYILINHKLTPLAMDGYGHMWLALCFVSISNHDKPGNIEVRKLGQSYYWKYDLDLDRWLSVPSLKLTDGEKEVLLLSARGLTVEEIAARVHRAKDSIKSRRKSIFDKLNVKSISEAIAFATNYKLI